MRQIPKSCSRTLVSTGWDVCLLSLAICDDDMLFFLAPLKGILIKVYHFLIKIETGIIIFLPVYLIYFVATLSVFFCTYVLMLLCLARHTV